MANAPNAARRTEVQQLRPPFKFAVMVAQGVATGVNGVIDGVHSVAHTCGKAVSGSSYVALASNRLKSIESQVESKARSSFRC